MVVAVDFPERPPAACLRVGWLDGFSPSRETVGSTFSGLDVSELVVSPAERILKLLWSRSESTPGSSKGASNDGSMNDCGVVSER